MSNETEVDRASVGAPTGSEHDPTVGELLNRLSEQTSRLVREEIKLAQAEMREKGKHAGLGIGLFSGAGLLAFFGAAVLIACAVLALALVLPAWASALIVGVLLLLAAGIAAMSGKKQVSQATPARPQRAVETTKQDVQEIKDRGHA